MLESAHFVIHVAGSGPSRIATDELRHQRLSCTNQLPILFPHSR